MGFERTQAGRAAGCRCGKKKGLKASDRWRYDERSHRYRDNKTGRFVSESTLRAATLQYAEDRKAIGPHLATQLADRSITVQYWLQSMRSSLRDTYTAEYLAGRGGRNAMTSGDWGKVGNMLRIQYGYLDKFAEEIAAGKLTELQIAARSKLYFGSAQQAYERGRVAARGMPELPAYPGDGGTECLGNCKCGWQITESKASWSCTWTLSDAEHCEGCIERAGQWNPLVIPKEK